MQTRISDLLDVVHLTIIKNDPSRENKIILGELQSIDRKIQTGALENYTVDETTFFKSIINSYK